MTWAPLVLQVAGAAFAAYGAYSASQSSKAAYNYQAGVTKNNAMIANWNADDAARRGALTEQETRQRTAALMGNQRATFAGRGIDLSEGSALNILSDTTYLGEQDVLTVRDNSAREVWKNKVAANDEKANGILLQSKSDSENPLLAGGTSLLTGAGKVADAWYKYKAA